MVQIVNPLDVSKRFNFELVVLEDYSINQELNKDIDRLFQKLKLSSRKRTSDNEKKKLLKIWVLNLIVTDRMKCYLVYSRNRERYPELRSKFGTHISYLYMRSIWENLEKKKFIESDKTTGKKLKGVYFAQFKRETRTRIMKNFRDHFGTKNITKYRIDIDPYKNSIILRKSITTTQGTGKFYKRGPKKGNEITTTSTKNVDVEYKERSKTRGMRKVLKAYNDLIRKSFIDIPDFPEKGLRYTGKTKTGDKTSQVIHIDRTNIFIRRIFNNKSFDQGGRFYGGWWWKLKKEYREKIKINDSWTQEIDYSGLHIRLCYHQEGINYKSDPYQIKIPKYKDADPEAMRRLLKQVFLIMINSKTEKQGIRGIRKDISNKNEVDGIAINDNQWFVDSCGEEGLTDQIILDLITVIKKKHKRIEKYFLSGEGIKLMKLDSMMAESIIRKFTEDNIPILCIHDSFIVQLEHLDRLERTMKTVTKNLFHKIFGVKSDQSKSDFRFEPLNPFARTKEYEWAVTPNRRYLRNKERWLREIYERSGQKKKITRNEILNPFKEFNWIRDYLNEKPEDYHKIDSKKKSYWI